MADRLALRSVSVAADFDVYHFTSEDGFPAAATFPVVYAQAVDGRHFYLPAGKQVRQEGVASWTARYDALDMCSKVGLCGTIDPDAWVEVEVWVPWSAEG